jgi:glycine cleavage system transcriptional repressor
MRHFAVSAVGRDRPGIVAAVSRVLLDHGVNIEDSQMTILRGHFTMMLIVAVPDDADEGELDMGLRRAGAELELEAITLQGVAELEASAPADASYIVTVYGIDHPGIVHAATTTLAERGVNITDLNTRLVGQGEGDPLYALMMEVALPRGLGAEELEAALAEVARAEGVETTLRELEQDTL